MKLKSMIRSAALATTCLVPIMAFAEEPAAEPNNEVTFGAQYQSADTAYGGRYNGDWNKGGRSTLDFILSGGSAWDSGGAYRYNVYGHNLDWSTANAFPEANVGFKVGSQGKWTAGFDYNAITYFQSDSFQSVWQSGGDGLLNPGIKPGTYNSWQANLVPLTTEDVKTRRDRYTATGKYDLGNGFSVETKLFHEHKEGTMEQSLAIGGLASSFFPPNATNSPPKSPLTGAPAASTAAGALGVVAYFPQPIDYDTDRYDVNLKYKADRLQTELGYSFAKFTNGNTAFYAMDPFSLAGPGATAAQKSTIYALPGQASYALPPNNYQHTIQGDLGYQITPTTALSGTLQYAWQIADNTLPLNGLALNPNLTPTAAQNQLIANPINGTSDQWNATAQVMNGNVTLTSRPLAHLDVKAAYTINTFKDTTNRTPVYNAGNVEENTAIPTTTLAQLQGTNCNGASVDSCTVPWAWTKQKSSLEANYQIFTGTKAGLGYTYNDNDHRYMLNDHYTESVYSAKVSSRFMPGLFAQATFEHGDRSAKVQNLGAAPNSPLEIPAFFVNNGAAMWFNSSRIQNTVKSKLSYALNDQLDIGVNGQWVTEHYPEISMLGLEKDGRESIGPQIGWRPSADFSTSLFYNYERINYQSASVYGTICSTAAGVASATVPSAAAPNPVCATGTTGQAGAAWAQNNISNAQTIGATAEWQASEKLKLSATYNYSLGNITWDYADNILPGTLAAMNPYYQYAWTAQPIPKVSSQLNSVKLRSEYKLTDSMTMLLGYTFEKFNNTDYNNDLQQATYASALLSKDASPNYTMHMVSAAMRFRF